MQIVYKKNAAAERRKTAAAKENMEGVTQIPMGTFMKKDLQAF